MRRNLLITSVLLFILVFCTQVVAQEHKLIFGHMGTTDTAYHAVAEFVAERVTELTNGNVKIEVYPNAELGDEQDLFEQVMMGVTDFTIVNPGVTVEFSQSMNFFNFPFLYSSREHWERVFTSPLVQKLSERVEKEAGVMILGVIGGGERFVVSRKPIQKVEDLDGFLMRLAPASITIDTWSSLGVQPTVVAYNEIYSALQMGVIDGLENEPEWILRMRFYEQAPYLVRTAHEIVSRPIVMSVDSFKGLPKEYQDAVLTAAKEGAELGRELGIKLDKESLDELVNKYDVRVFDVDIDKIRGKTAGVIEKNAKQLQLYDLVEEVSELR